MKLVLALLLVSVFVISLAISPVSAYRIFLVGDLSCGSSTLTNSIKSKGNGLVVFLGDLCYGSNLDSFKSVFWNKFADKKCVIGNHDSSEDGGSTITAQAKLLCGQVWYKQFSHPDGSKTMTIGFNSNGNLDTQLGTAQSWVMNSTIMKGVKFVSIVSHKPAYVFPNAHHPVESKVKTFVDSLVAKIPTGVTTKIVSGHNHNLAKTSDGSKWVSGAGGKSHYDCGTSSTWTYCDETHYGFLMFNVVNGTMTYYHFYDKNGVVLK